MTTSIASPLKNKTYQRLFSAQITSLMGTGVTTIALALLAFDLAEGQAGRVLGTALAIKMIAYVGIAPFAGAYLQAFDRKKVMIFLDVIRAFMVLSFPFITEIWQLYVVIFVLNAASACFTPLFQAVIPDILPNEARYTKALSYARLAYDLENLLSPTLAALLLTFWHFDLLFFLNALSFLVSALLVASATFPARPFSDQEEGRLSGVFFGIKSYLKTPRLQGLLALYGVVSCAGAMMIVNTVVYVQGTLGGSETETALVMMAAGFGSMVVALTLPQILTRVPDRPVMMIGASIAATGLLAAVSLPGFIGLSVLWVCLGAGTSLIQTPAGRLVTRSCRQGDRGAFFAANFTLSHAMWFIGYLGAGFLGSSIGLAQTFGIFALGSFVLVMLALRLWPKNDPVVVVHVHEEKVHAHPHTHDDPHHDHDHEGWEGEEPHIHEHRHRAVRHTHDFVIDTHHQSWPK